MAPGKRASMRDGPLAALFRKTTEEADANRPVADEDPSASSEDETPSPRSEAGSPRSEAGSPDPEAESPDAVAEPEREVDPPAPEFVAPPRKVAKRAAAPVAPEITNVDEAETREARMPSP